MPRRAELAHDERRRAARPARARPRRRPGRRRAAARSRRGARGRAASALRRAGAPRHDGRGRSWTKREPRLGSSHPRFAARSRWISTRPCQRASSSGTAAIESTVAVGSHARRGDRLVAVLARAHEDPGETGARARRRRRSRRRRRPSRPPLAAMPTGEDVVEEGAGRLADDDRLARRSRTRARRRTARRRARARRASASSGSSAARSAPRRRAAAGTRG